MRILLFSSTYRPLVGGVETVTSSLARELTALGHDVSVVTNRYPRNLKSFESIDGIEVTRRLYPNLVPSPGRRPAVTIVKQLLSIPLGIYELFWLILHFRRTKPDVLNIHYLSYPAVYALIAGTITGLPMVLSFHGSDVPSSPYPATYRWLARICCRLANSLTVNSEDLAGYLRRDLANPGPVQVIPFGVDEWEEQPAELDEADRLYILVASRLVRKKGVEVAIQAMGLLRDSGEPMDTVRLLIAGDGSLRSELESLVSQLRLADQVTFLGSLEPARLHQFIAGSLFVAVPSEWEAFGVIALEAMIGGKAVVASGKGGITEIVIDGETGLLVPPHESAALAEAFRDLIRDRERAARLGAAGRARAVSEYSWSTAGRQFNQVLLAAAANGGWQRLRSRPR